MAKEMDVSLVCMLPDPMMDVLLKVQTKTGEHTFWEDVYTQSLKYRRWNNQLRPFRSLKKRVANIFRKRASYSDDSRGTSSQSLINDIERDSEKSVNSDWSDLILIDVEAEYWRIYNIRKRSATRLHTSTVLSAALLLKLFQFHPLPKLTLIKQ